jgi:PAS domain-containing protein
MAIGKTPRPGRARSYDLRRRAEARMVQQKAPVRDEGEQLLHEPRRAHPRSSEVMKGSWFSRTLEVHQVELQVQNEELQAQNEELQAQSGELQAQNEELQAARLELDHATVRLADLFECAPIAYVTLDPGGTILVINQAGVRLLGQERKRLTGGRLASSSPRVTAPSTTTSSRVRSLWVLAVDRSASSR